jgi:hypothetical protein
MRKPGVCISVIAALAEVSDVLLLSEPANQLICAEAAGTTLALLWTSGNPGVAR